VTVSLTLAGGSCGTLCPADLNFDGEVDGADLGLLLAAWGTADPCADLSGDGVVSGADLGLLLAAFGGCPTCPDSDHDCFTTGGPGCTDQECCEAVCAADPFCCETAWDALCVNAAFTLCGPGNCPGVGDCFQQHGGMGCSDPGCCTEVCVDQNLPACCAIAWDQTCADIACRNCTQPVNGAACFAAIPEDERCGSDANGGCNEILVTSSCCIANDVAGCSEPNCEATICAVDFFCCEVIWDGLCAEQALALCNDLCAPSLKFGTISGGETICGSLWAVGGVRDVDWYEFSLDAPARVNVLLTPEQVCEMGILTSGECGDPAAELRWKPSAEGPCPPGGSRFLSACLGAGSHKIVVATKEYSGLPCGPGSDSDPLNKYLLSLEVEECTECVNSDHDCFTEGGPGCLDFPCCSQVCFVDPFCCEVAWDGLCVSAATLLCAQPQCPFDCDSFSTPEGEHCGADTNGGCNSVPPVFGAVACEEIICGLTWADGNFRDTDWFQITLTQPTTIELGICTEIPMVMGIVATGGVPDCALASQLGPYTLAPACLCVSFSTVVPAGTWWIFAAPQTFLGYPCATGPHRYQLYVSCQ